MSKYAEMALKANREGKILVIENGEFVFKDPPVIELQEDVEPCEKSSA